MNELKAERILELEKERVNPYKEYNHIVIEKLELDYADLSMEIRPEHLNPYGMLHGGAMCAIADNATGAAVHTDGRTYVTSSSTVFYLGNVSDGTVHCVARVTHRGKSTALTSIEITGEDGIVLARGEYSFFCLSDKGLADQADESAIK